MQPPNRFAAVVVAIAAACLLSSIGCGPGAEDPAASAQGGTAAPVTAPEGAPNVLLVVIDTLRADHLDLYGYARSTAPRLTAMAAGGVTFLHAVSQAPTTVPSHATMFTGRYPHQHGTDSYTTPLPPSEETMAELFSAGGWRTFAVASSQRFDPGSGFRQGFESFELVLDSKEAERSAAVTRRTLDQIAASDGRPFFGFVHYMQPHAPYDPPAPLDTRFHPGLDELSPRHTGRFVRNHSDLGDEVAPEIVALLEALYDAEILSLDAQLGRLFDALDEMGMAGNTLLVLTADHGEEFREHGRLAHHQLHAELLGVPLIVRWPDRLPAGARVQRPVELAGLLPTLADLAGLPIPERATGRSFANELLPGSGRVAAHPDPRREALDRMDVLLAESSSGHWAVTATLPTGRFKLMNDGGDVLKLYQLDEDPTERHDVSWAFQRELAALRELVASIAPEEAPPDRVRRVPDEQARAWLMELGYVEEVR